MNIKNRFIIITSFLLFIHSQSYAQNFKLVEDGDFTKDILNTNGVSFIDIDVDGDLDLFLSNANLPYGPNVIYRNDGNDNFVKVDAGEVTGLQTATFGHTWGDFNNDGKPDLFIANGFTKFGSILYANMGNFKFRRVESYNLGNKGTLAFDAGWADYNNDGWLDLVTIHPSGFVGKPIESNALFKNNSNGTFSYIAVTPITGPTAPFTNGTWSDYDLDGDMDLFIGSGPANGTVAPDFLYQNQLKETESAGFRRIGGVQYAIDAMDGQTWNWIDYDNDGDLDAFMTNYSGQPNPQGTPAGMLNNLYRNDGDTVIRVVEGPLVNETSVSLANMWADFDNDGYLDVIIGNSGSTNKHYRNKGNGTFEYMSGSPIETPGAKNTWGMTYGDYDNDGDIDIYISTKAGYITGGQNGGDLNYLYRNDLENGNNWLIIKCIGMKSNKSAIGAIVRLTSKIGNKLVTQTRVIGTNNTFLGDNDIRAHFGLAKGKMIEKITIQWPSGQLDTYQNIKPNQFLDAIEGQSLK